MWHISKLDHLNRAICNQGNSPTLKSLGSWLIWIYFGGKTVNFFCYDDDDVAADDKDIHHFDSFICSPVIFGSRVLAHYFDWYFGFQIYIYACERVRYNWYIEGIVTAFFLLVYLYLELSTSTVSLIDNNNINNNWYDHNS